MSGTKGRDQRSGFISLHKAIARRDVDIVAAWSVDGLGRSLPDLAAFLNQRAVQKTLGLKLCTQEDLEDD